ncbi:MAG: bifunctional folylpolyglutamate synthase/dihydrofolate synthase [Elusimicrobiaceae bacterium]|nr:bifunctional folylpolyglutamate synthase/dihydrofolate synthase [Elusimicrobiaceae bacterium]
MIFNDWFYELQSTRSGLTAGAGLTAFRALLGRLGNPHQQLQIIHVAGTNGKGTVCTLLAHTLTCAGYKTGLFISPHLISPVERIQLDGSSIDENDFIQIVQQVLEVEEEPLTLFEILTAAAFLYFAGKRAQYVVLETGIGGRKDPTNVCLPLLSIITSIGLDHTHLLGTAISQIAYEKAGIIKSGVPVLCGALPAEAEQVICEVARQQNAPLQFVRTGDPFNEMGIDMEHGWSEMSVTDGTKWNLHTLGRMQVQNACLVYQAAQRFKVPENSLRYAFETVQIPGRFEIFRHGQKTIILDGAHNPQAIENLLLFWEKTPYAKKKPLVLCGFMRDKDYPQILKMLSARFNRGVVTVPPNKRGASLAQIQQFLPTGWEVEEDVNAAFLRAQVVADVILCTGSFYVVGAIRSALF